MLGLLPLRHALLSPALDELITRVPLQLSLEVTVYLFSESGKFWTAPELPIIVGVPEKEKRNVSRIVWILYRNGRFAFNIHNRIMIIF